MRASIERLRPSFVTSSLAACALLALGGTRAGAQEIEPRAYSNAPVGVNFVIAGYAYTQGGLAFDPALPVENPELHTSSAVLAYARAIDFFGSSAKLDAIAPYTWLSGSADVEGEPRSREVDGLADMKARITVHLYGAPALDAKEFAAYEQDLILGASLQVTAPTGRYDDDRAVNIGANRWSFKPEVGASKAWGPWTFELAAAVVLFTDNDEFLGDRAREQGPLYSVQAHVIRSFVRGVWGSLDATYFTGGNTTLDGVEQDDRQENWRIGTTLAVPVAVGTSIKLYASTGVAARTGNDFDLLGAALQYRWGGGT